MKKLFAISILIGVLLLLISQSDAARRWFFMNGIPLRIGLTFESGSTRIDRAGDTRIDRDGNTRIVR